MPHIDKIVTVLEALGYKDDSLIRFTVKRYERVDNHHVKISATSKDKLMDVFTKFHERVGVKIIGKDFPSSAGQLKRRDFIIFLREYDEKFDLNWCEIELKEISFKPMYLE